MGAGGRAGYMDGLHLAFTDGSTSAHVDGYFLAFDPAVDVPDLRVAEKQHGLRRSVILGIISARLAVAVAVLEVSGLPDLAHRLRADIKNRVQAVGVGQLRGAPGGRGGRGAEKHLGWSESAQGFNVAVLVEGHLELTGRDDLFPGFGVGRGYQERSGPDGVSVFQAMAIGPEVKPHLGGCQGLPLRALTCTGFLRNVQHGLRFQVDADVAGSYTPEWLRMLTTQIHVQSLRG